MANIVHCIYVPMYLFQLLQFYNINSTPALVVFLFPNSQRYLTEDFMVNHGIGDLLSSVYLR